MAIANADRMKMWSAKTTVELRQKSIMYNLLDKSWESDWANGQHTVNIPVIDWDTSIPTPTRARGGDWAANAELTQSIAALTRTGGYGTRTDIPWDDVLEVPWPTIARTRSRQTWAMRNQIDRGIYATVAAAPSDTITGGTSSTTYVARTSPYDYVIATGKRHPVAEVIELFALEMTDANVIDGDSSPTGDAGMPFVIMQPHLGLSLARWLETQNLHFDPLSMAMFYQNPSAIMQPNPLHMYRGVMVITWNALTVPTSGNEWAFYGGCMAAAACGLRPPIVQYFPPELNQTSTEPAHMLRQIGDFAAVELDDTLHFKLEVHEA